MKRIHKEIILRYLSEAENEIVGLGIKIGQLKHKKCVSPACACSYKAQGLMRDVKALIEAENND